MKNRIVLYHSGTGNNAFLAKQIAQGLDADLGPLQPRITGTGWLYLLSLLKWGCGIRPTTADLEAYDEVVVVGPVWGGLLIAPLRQAIKRCVKAERPVHFAICCGISDEEKDHRYGYAQVLRAAEAAGEGYVKTAAAFPIGLALPPGVSPEDADLMQLRLNADNYPGTMKKRVDRFLEQIEQEAIPKTHRVA